MRAVVVNSRYIYHRLTGVERYSTEIVQRLGGVVRLVSPQTNLRGWRGHLWEQVILPRRLRSSELLWSMANSGPLAVPQQVLSLHDLSVLDHPEWYSRSFSLWYRLMLPRLARRVRAIFTTSCYVKIRILKAGWIAEGQVNVIPGGVNLEHFYPRDKIEIERIRKKYHLPENYFLTVGSLQPRKNLARVLEAFERNFGPSSGAGLAVVGEGGSNFQPISISPHPENIYLCGYAAESHLPALYSGALALVFVSLEEGFGLPGLEAMACGTPVIASRAGGLPEMTGEAAVLVDPFSVEEIAKAMSRVGTDAELRRELRERGIERAQEFTWDRSAQRAWKLLQILRSSDAVK